MHSGVNAGRNAGNQHGPYAASQEEQRIADPVFKRAHQADADTALPKIELYEYVVAVADVLCDKIVPGVKKRECRIQRVATPEYRHLPYAGARKEIQHDEQDKNNAQYDRDYHQYSLDYVLCHAAPVARLPLLACAHTARRFAISKIFDQHTTKYRRLQSRNANKAQ
jgi:hypothetical protein